MRIALAALVPAYNEESVIEETLNSILRAGLKKENVYVIDDGSKDNTARIANSLGVKVLTNNVNLGKANSVNLAIHKLHLLDRYTHICFLDADTLVDSKYFQVVRSVLSENKKSFERNKKRIGKPIAILCGKAKSIPHNYLTAFRAYEYWITHKIHKPAQASMRVIMVAPGCASTYSSDILRKVSWSDDTIVEDMDMTIRIALMGEEIAYEDKAIVYTQDPRRLRDYIGQVGRRWYPGTWQVVGKHGLLWKGLCSRLHWECRMLILEPFVYIGTIIWTAVYEPNYLTLTFTSVAVLTFVLSVFASIEERRWDILKFSPAYPFIFFLNLFMFTGKVRNINKQKSKKENLWFSPERYENIATEVK